MPNSNFFNNVDTTLFDKFKGIATNMSNFYAFKAVVGYFRSSGYFKLRQVLGDVKKIKILVGINIDSIFRHRDKTMLMFGSEEEAKKLFTQDFINDIREARYAPEVEEGILQLCQDLADGRVEIRIHKSRNLHAKFYICLPENFNENTDGRVIMGSSNISESGLGITQPPRYELNVALRDYDDVEYCNEQFETLWQESVALEFSDMVEMRKKTHLDHMPTPYEIFIKVLIDAFGDQVEDDFNVELPEGYINLKYQRDAMIQGYQMLKSFDGFFLADVVGTGKTIIASMIAKRFIEENGRHTNILVVYPPAVEKNWKDTFRDFGITKYAQFISNGSLDKILEGRDNYKSEEEFDMVIVDEAHNFRNDTAERYDKLQRICKAPRTGDGLVEGSHKKVILLSATPLNNEPSDFLNLLLLFQDARRPTIDGVQNLNLLFSPWIQRYKELMKMRRSGGGDAKELSLEVDKIYEQMRTDLLDKILVRRTRKNLLNNPEYRADLDRQGVRFPHIEQPIECVYQMDSQLSELFHQTLDELTDTQSEENPDGDGISYARYRAIEFLTEDYRDRYPQAKHVATLLAAIYRVHMVKRLESSFFAFKQSLSTFLRITNDMIHMFEENKVIIAPEFNVKGMLESGLELDEVIERLLSRGVPKEEIVYEASAFRPEFLEMLKSDAQKLEALCERWKKVEDDPKFEEFVKLMQGEIFQAPNNPTGKVVVFSESVDTLSFLEKKLKERLGREDILMVSAESRGRKLNKIRSNFDANLAKGEQKDDYNIILTSDVLAEGVNLHRSNVIVNYDSPWNATRLMQRIGRVNRIGSTAASIYNYMFYPSHEGNNEIKLYENALMKIQGFHAALGEDAQIYSRQEILHEFKLFDENVHDSIDRRLELLREVRELYASDRKLYREIKALPVKSRTVRKSENHPSDIAPLTSVVHISRGGKSWFYSVADGGVPKRLDFVEAADILRAPKDEQPGNMESVKQVHYEQVRKAYDSFLEAEQAAEDTESLAARKIDSNAAKALKFLRNLQRTFSGDDDCEKISALESYVKAGIFNQLTKSVNRLHNLASRFTRDGSPLSRHKEKLLPVVEQLYDKYHVAEKRRDSGDYKPGDDDPIIVTSETFE